MSCHDNNVNNDDDDCVVMRVERAAETKDTAKATDNLRQSIGSVASDVGNNTSENAMEERTDNDNDNDNGSDSDVLSEPVPNNAPFHRSHRTYLELNVGAHHLVEVVICVRRMDWRWFRTRYASHIQDELMDLLQESVLPRMFGDELEAYYKQRYSDSFPQTVADISAKTTKGRERRVQPAAASGRGRRGKARRNDKRGTKQTKRKAAQVDGTKATASLTTTTIDKPPKEVYYAFGETIQLAHRRREIRKTDKGASLEAATVVHAPIRSSNPYSSRKIHSSDSRGNPASTGRSFRFTERIRLSHQLVVWCCRLDPKSATNPDPPNFGFHRPDMVPMASLFRQLDADDRSGSENGDGDD